MCRGARPADGAGPHARLGRLLRWLLSPLQPAVAESGFAGAAGAIKAAWDAGDRARAAALVPDALVEAVALVGPAEACRARLDQYRDAGLTLPIVTPRVDGPDAMAEAVAALRALAPGG